MKIDLHEDILNNTKVIDMNNLVNMKKDQKPLVTINKIVNMILHLMKEMKEDKVEILDLVNRRNISLITI